MFKSTSGTYTAQIPSHSTAWSFWQCHAPKLHRGEKREGQGSFQTIKTFIQMIKSPHLCLWDLDHWCEDLT